MITTPAPNGKTTAFELPWLTKRHFRLLAELLANSTRAEQFEIIAAIGKVKPIRGPDA